MKKKIGLNFLTVLLLVLFWGGPIIFTWLTGHFYVFLEVISFFIGLAILVGWIIEIRDNRREKVKSNKS